VQEEDGGRMLESDRIAIENEGDVQSTEDIWRAGI
jgi:hypothetical protein